ncbi:pyridine nucleotide-disulfide oxidoreductase domain-containing protein [Ditylenchus destructor]|uniref:Pyridine nucleotide-disulfide oxidoreductase domain-containing protein n=1 Tax=Ditylenchus destructor TaxID=166010 RepID=A0AAD4MJ93_9BILA|nr:pyridine nucleotide-disulfide oxidoreductase domain-containing protein [Ditylenchus destructor]
MKDHFRLLIAGGGTAGCAIASRFSRFLKAPEIAVVEPCSTHCYQPGLTFVGAGILKVDQIVRPEKDVLSRNVTWINESISAFKPNENSISLRSGEEISYDFLVIATGLELRYDMIKGLKGEHLSAPNSALCSIYDLKYAHKVYEELRQLKPANTSRNVIFTHPNSPIKCPGATQKICYLAEEYLRKRGLCVFRPLCLSLALIPPEHVRRAFMFIVGKSVPGLQGWLGYFASNYIGLSQLEKDRGAAAFDPLRVFLRRSRSTERFSTPSTIATPSPMATLSSMLSRQSRSSLRSSNPLNATLPSRPSTLSSRSSFQLVQRWDIEIVQKPRYAIPFWNVFNRTQNAIERTNNGMEVSHKYFAKDLNHRPSLSDYLAALLIDVDKQVDTARAVRLQHSRARPMRNVIKEQHVMNVLDDANFDTDEGLIDAVQLLGLVMQGFVDGLRVPNEDEEENETSEEE